MTATNSHSKVQFDITEQSVNRQSTTRAAGRTAPGHQDRRWFQW